MKDFVQVENVLGASNNYLLSGGQIGAHTALFSPKGKDGLPKPLFDPTTGEIDACLTKANGGSRPKQFSTLTSKNHLLTSRKVYKRLLSYHPNSAPKDETVAGKTANCPVQATPPRKYLAVSIGRPSLPRV